MESFRRTRGRVPGRNDGCEPLPQKLKRHTHERYHRPQNGSNRTMRKRGAVGS